MIPTQTLHRAAARLEPRDFVQLLGMQPFRSRAGHTSVICPWHGDKSPSCDVDNKPGRGIVACCRACSGRGDALSLIAAVEGLSTRTDFKRVAERAAVILGVEIDESRLPPRRPPSVWERRIERARQIVRRLDDAYDNWVRGRNDRLDAVLDSASPSEIEEAWRAIFRRDAASRRRNAARDAELDKVGDELAAAGRLRWEP